MIKILNVSYHYPGGKGIMNISFDLSNREFALLVGKTGAGKTTLFRLISQEIRAEAGEVQLEWNDNRYLSGKLRYRDLPKWRRALGIVYQDNRLLDDRTVLENVKLAAMCDRSLTLNPKERALSALGLVGLSHKPHSMPKELSAGEAQRVAIARAIVNEPFALLADEPVSHLDKETSDEIISLLMQLNNAGTAMLIATHQPERFELCKPRVIRLEQGRVIEK